MIRELKLHYLIITAAFLFLTGALIFMSSDVAAIAPCSGVFVFGLPESTCDTACAGACGGEYWAQPYMGACQCACLTLSGCYTCGGNYVINGNNCYGLDSGTCQDSYYSDGGDQSCIWIDAGAYGANCSSLTLYRSDLKCTLPTCVEVKPCSPCHLGASQPDTELSVSGSCQADCYTAQQTYAFDSFDSDLCIWKWNNPVSAWGCTYCQWDLKVMYNEEDDKWYSSNIYWGFIAAFADPMKASLLPLQVPGIQCLDGGLAGTYVLPGVFSFPGDCTGCDAYVPLLATGDPCRCPGGDSFVIEPDIDISSYSFIEANVGDDEMCLEIVNSGVSCSDAVSANVISSYSNCGECCAAPPCVDECSPADSPRCVDDDTYETCEDHNGDGCLEWGGTDCSGGTLYCDSATGNCVECLTDNDCSDPAKPYCDFFSVCVECLEDDHCNEGKRFCEGNLLKENVCNVAGGKVCDSVLVENCGTDTFVKYACEYGRDYYTNTWIQEVNELKGCSDGEYRAPETSGACGRSANKACVQCEPDNGQCYCEASCYSFTDKECKVYSEVPMLTYSYDGRTNTKFCKSKWAEPEEYSCREGSSTIIGLDGVSLEQKRLVSRCDPIKAAATGDCEEETVWPQIDMCVRGTELVRAFDHCKGDEVWSQYRTHTCECVGVCPPDAPADCIGNEILPGEFVWEKHFIDCPPPDSLESSYCVDRTKMTVKWDFETPCEETVAGVWCFPKIVNTDITLYTCDFCCENAACVGVCNPGTRQACGDCGTQTCNASCGWGPCQDQGPCSPGDVLQNCGVCGTQTCDAECQWGICEEHYGCEGEDCICLPGLGANECTTLGHNPAECPPGEDNPPYPKNIITLPETYCVGISGCGEVSFQWIYQDIDGDEEVRFDFQVDDNDDFSSPEVDRTFGGLSNPVGSINTQIILVRTFPTYTGCDYIGYDTSYYWRVRVWDDTGLNSDWVEYDDPSDPDNDGDRRTFTKAPHAFPDPEFSFIPVNPVPGEDVSFIDLSICYDNNNNPYPCKDDPAPTHPWLNLYLWEFGDGSTSTTKGNVSHPYDDTGIYIVKLKITDDLGPCDVEDNVPVTVSGGGLFEWKEISPF